MGPEEVHEIDQRAEAPPPQAQAERAGALQHGEEKAPAGVPVVAFQYLRGAYRKAEEGLLRRVCGNRTGENGFKQEEGTFRLDIRKFFTVRVVRHWK